MNLKRASARYLQGALLRNSSVQHNLESSIASNKFPVLGVASFAIACSTAFNMEKPANFAYCCSVKPHLSTNVVRNIARNVAPYEVKPLHNKLQSPTWFVLYFFHC